jgi:hypothetical protein
MVNQRHAFKHRDVVRAVKAAKATGINASQVTVDPRTGEITVGPAPGVAGAVLVSHGGEPKEASPLDRWKATRGQS